jgi:hypothetical protein
MSKSLDNNDVKRGVDLEYNTLRGEILKRVELRQQLVSITLTLAGIFMSIGLSSELVVLIYPPLAALLAFSWAQNDVRIGTIAKYIRENLEILPLGLRYETYSYQERAKEEGLGSFRFVIISHTGIFLFTQLMAVAIEIAKSTSFSNFSALKWVLLSIDLIAVATVAWIMRKISIPKERTRKSQATRVKSKSASE